MPAIVWPITLPQLRLPNPTMSREAGFIETAMEYGPPKRRRRTFASRKQYAIGVELTGSELSIFETFYKTTLRQGTLGFEWSDPVTEATVTYFFRDYPQWKKTIGSGDPAKDRWEGTLSLEVRDA